MGARIAQAAPPRPARPLSREKGKRTVGQGDCVIGVAQVEPISRCAQVHETSRGGPSQALGEKRPCPNLDLHRPGATPQVLLMSFHIQLTESIKALS